MKRMIQGKKVILRSLQQSDLPLRARWTADRELCSLMGVIDEQELQELSKEDGLQNNRKWLENRHKSGVMPYAIEVDGRYIGDIDFGIYLNQRKADLTVFLGDRREWGKGYGTEAVELVLEKFFADKISKKDAKRLREKGLKFEEYPIVPIYKLPPEERRILREKILV